MAAKVMKKKKNVAKNQKLYWRKYTDIEDVDEFLNEKRLEERIGIPFKEKKDEELFIIDTNSNETAVKLKQSKLSKKQKALLPPRCFEILKPLTAVPDPITKRNRVRTREERKCPLRKAIEEKRRLSGYVPKKLIEARKSREISLRQKKLSKKPQQFNKDLWDVTNNNDNQMGEINWLREDTIRHNLANTGALQITVPESVKKKKSVLPTIEPPHPGTSYNPSMTDHQQLLDLVITKEMEKQKQEAHIKRVTNDLFNRVTPMEKHSTWLEEMSQGLPHSEKNEEMEEVTNDDFKPVKAPVSFLKKKTRQQRRKQKLEKEAALTRKEAKVEKKKIADLYKLKFIGKKIKETEEEHLKKADKRKNLAELNVGRTKRLGPKQYEEPDIVFKRGHELTGSLRTLKSEGNLLADRFYSLQKRNMLVPSLKRIGGKKAKLKSFYKASHKLENIENK